MTDTAVTQEPEPAPVEAPVTGLPASSDTPADDLQSLLDEFSAKTAPPAAETDLPPDGEANQETAAPDQTFDQQLQELLGPSAEQKKLTALEGQLNELRRAEHMRAEIEAFDKYASDLARQVSEIAPHVPPDYIRVKLESLAHNEEIRLAWETRGINPADAGRDLAYVQANLRQLQGDPNVDPKQVQELNRLAYQLNIACHSAAILRRVNNNILKEARALKPPLDPDASADRAAVAFAVREASSGDLPEPQVDLGKLSDVEFRKHLRDKYNISGF
jgi:hypothetical protein